MSQTIVDYKLTDAIAVITMDDGKVNALSHALLTALNEALDRAESEAKAVVIAGRPGRFSAGFDLSVMGAGAAAAAGLLRAGSNLFMRVYRFPKPVVMAVSGHAIAGGVLLAATGDTRIGIHGEFKLGLNEVANGMPVPILAHRLAQDRLSARELVPAVLQAKLYNPEAAAEAGWLDRVVAPEALAEQSLAEAMRLSKLSAGPYAITKESLRRTSIEHITATLDSDLAALSD